jgi:ribonuclease Z
LLDVGEGTAAQIFQSVGGDVSRYDAVLLSIKVIWISHHHADHITGLPQLVEQIQRAHMRAEADSSSFAISEQKALRAVRSKYSLTSQFRRGGSLYDDDSKVMLVAAEGVMKYFEFALSAAGLDDLVTLYPVVNTLYAGATSDVAAATHGHVTRLRSIPVQHCHSSYGIVLDLSSGHKVVYSGDCRPSQSLVKAGADCDLLIHEATFDDSMAADALKKKHSTASEARGVAAQMRAKHTVLTHFSQRYPVGQTGPAQSEGVVAPPDMGSMAPLSLNCSLAFDFLRFSFPSQMGALPRACSEMVSVLAALETERQMVSQA